MARPLVLFALFLLGSPTFAQRCTTFCVGDGVAPHAPCPCSNNSSVPSASGCGNSLGLGGTLRCSGLASISSDTLVLEASNMPNIMAVFVQGTSRQNLGNGTALFDGLRCTAGVLKTLASKSNVGGASHFPEAADLPISLVGSASIASTRHYQVVYRDNAAFCVLAPWNLTNGVSVTWLP